MHTIFFLLLSTLCWFLYTFSTYLHRNFQFWYYATGPALHYASLYYLHKYKFIDTKRYNQRWLELDEIYAKHVYDALVTMKGIYVKIAQILAGRPDFIPPPFYRECTKFLSNCPSVEYDVIKKIIEQEYGAPITHIFSEFNEKPLGAASIAQAHLARLKTGEKVVVKVQYPWIEDMMTVDLQNALFLTWCFNKQSYKELDGSKKMYYDELDFDAEVKSLRYIYDSLEPFRNRKGTKMIRIPEPLEAYCTKYIIVMTYLEGDSLQGHLDEQMKQFQEISNVDIRNADFQDFEPPQEEQLKVIRGLLSMRQKVWNGLAKTTNSVFGNMFHILGRKNNVLIEYETSLPINSEELLDNLIDVMGYQMLVLGKFTTDPHAGNLLINSSGSLGLIDFGQVWDAPLADRKLLAKLLLSVLHRDRPAVVKYFKEMGFETKKNDVDFLYLLAVLLFDSIDYKLMEEILGTNDKLAMMKKLTESGDLDGAPPDFVAFIRAAMIIQGSAMQLLCTPSLAKAWEKYCLQILNDEPQQPKAKSWWKKQGGKLAKRAQNFALDFAPVVFPKTELKMMVADV